jgi:flagellar biosynthesis/type III secretory pathway protein FliH
VEVHSPGEPVRSVGPGEELTAPGVLRNPVPVEALYDRATAHEVTLRNLLQRRGYNGLEEVREEGREEGLEAGREEGREEGLEAGREEGREEGLEAGREEGLEAGREEGRRQILAQQIRHRFGELSEAHSARLASAGVETLGLWAERILTASSMEDLFGTE